MSSEETKSRFNYNAAGLFLALLGIVVGVPIYMDWVYRGVANAKLYSAKVDAQIREYEAMKPTGGIIVKLDDLISSAEAEHRKVEYIEEHKYP